MSSCSGLAWRRFPQIFGALLLASCAAEKEGDLPGDAGGTTGAGGAQASSASGSSGAGGAFEPAGSGGAPDTPETCAELVGELNSMGCEFWAVDLDQGVNAPSSLEFDTPGECADWQFAEGVSVCADGTGKVAGVCPFDGDCSEAGPGFSCSVHDLCVLDPQHGTFAIALANPHDSAVATVEISDASGLSKTVSVPPGDITTVRPADLGFADHSLDHTSILPGGYRIVSDRPIAAYQFNPELGIDVFSADASLLLPVAALDGDYVVVTQPSAAFGNAVQWNGYFSVAATKAGTTTVEVTASAPLRPGAGIPSIAPGETRVFTLEQHDVLTLEGGPNADVSGSRVHADAAVAVFAGHEAAAISVANPFVSGCCADHLEEQLPPVSVWGSEHLVAKSQRIAEYYWDRAKVVARADGTIVSVAPSGETCFLDAGESCELMVDQDLAITSSAPVMVLHLLCSGGGIAPNRGDPAIAVIPPIEQWRTSYTLLAPAYPLNYLSIVAPAASTLMLDGTDVSLALSATIGTHAIARIPIEAGKHDLSCSDTCSVEVYGLGDDVSYMYAGGLNLLPQPSPR